MQPERQRRSGCLIALYALLGVVAFVVLVGGASLLWFLRTEEGRETFEAVREGVDWALEAQRAEGTDSLREAGCDLALVSDLERLEGVLTSLFPELRLHALEGLPRDEALVLCGGDPNTMQGPICPALARTYGDSLGSPPERFVLLVQDRRRGELVCQGLYAPDGTLLEAIELEIPAS